MGAAPGHDRGCNARHGQAAPRGGVSSSEFGTERAKRTASILRDRIGTEAPVAGIILGSGLGGLADRIVDRTVVGYADIPGFPVPTVVGHSGTVVAGTLGGRRVVA